ncbi:hypothetical protein EDD62_1185 [Abyssicoccus albus]|uniref:Uncharacterized protein n=1 Tax=Abyssicoccus albus TaxID=1817405 RepID=A0A3N5BGB3_9BACL|nr:hypothetical protein EDD62_1185 [Abyssicoccus albus]
MIFIYFICAFLFILAVSTFINFLINPEYKMLTRKQVVMFSLILAFIVSIFIEVYG